MNTASRTCVVICYWTGRSPRPLYRLLRMMQKVPAGAPFDVLIVCNGGDEKPLVPRPGFESLNVRIINRENAGWNLGAWEAGWRASPGYDYFLFLQAECFIRNPDWIARFVHRIERDSGIGMLGERLMWQQMTWDYVRAATELDLGARGPVPEGVLESIARYQRLLVERGIDPGSLGTHLVSIILFLQRSVLEEIGGFPLIGESYLEAVGCEIGLSKLVEARGYRISQVADDAFSRIGHTQWSGRESGFRSLLSRMRSAVRRLRGQ